MSMAIRRASYTGDPGFFGDIFGGIKGAIGGAVRGFTGMTRQPPIPTAGPGSVQLYTGPRMNIAARNGHELQKVPGLGGFLERLAPGGASGFMANGGAPCDTAGYHLNKSAYFLMSGEFVPEGSRYVRNRKRNPANARATSRAISRVVGAKRYATSLSRISIRKKC